MPGYQFLGSFDSAQAIHPKVSIYRRAKNGEKEDYIFTDRCDGFAEEGVVARVVRGGKHDGKLQGRCSIEVKVPMYDVDALRVCRVESRCRGI